MRLLAVLLLTVGLLSGLTPATAAPLRIITVGTSIEYGTGHGPGESWPQRLNLRAPADWVFSDNSLPGGAYTSRTKEGFTIRDKVNEAIALKPDVLILGGPVNDLVSLSDVTPLRQAVFDAVNAAKSAGIPKVLVMGIFPVNDCDGCPLQLGWWPNIENRRQTYNTWARDMYGLDYIDSSWWLHETSSQRGDRRWLRDSSLHYTRTGAALIAEVFPLERIG